MKEPKSKKELILEAAVQVFSNCGYDSARMEEIAETAGIGKGTIYEYFDSKLQLFREMMMKCWEEYNSAVQEENLTRMNLRSFIRKILQEHIRFSQEKRELVRILLWDPEIMDQELKQWIYLNKKEREQILQLVVNRAIAAKEIKPIDFKSFYLIIAGLIGSVWAFTTLDNLDMNPDLLSEQIVDIIMDGIAY